MNNDLLSRLADLDAAPRTELSAAELDRKQQLLRTVLEDTGQPVRTAGAPFRRPLLRRVAFTAAGGLAAAAAVLAATGILPGSQSSGPLSSAQLASWTATPAGLDSSSRNGGAAEKWCLDASKGGQDDSAPAKISNADIRGSVASMVVTRAGATTYCLAGSDGSGVSMALDTVAAGAAADAVTLDTLGARGSDSGQFNYALGSVGADVREVTVRDSGQTVQATVQDGRWTAWWPDGNPDGLLTGTLTLTLADGTTRTVDGPSLLG